ncbi:MAG: radical SAM protein, partial [Nanoarchaeota archaeon]|nr:radical SAM protein [Nanoarchaeota archaeon]
MRLQPSEVLFDSSGRSRFLHVEQVIIPLVHRCFFRCRTCECWKSPGHENVLTLKDYRSLFPRLRKISGQNTVLSLTGGEPFLNKDIFEIIHLAKKSGFRTTANTNGWLLDREKIVRLHELGLDTIVFSL